MKTLTCIGGPKNGEQECLEDDIQFIHVDWFPESGVHVAGKYRRTQVSVINLGGAAMTDHMKEALGREILLWHKEEVRRA